MDLHQVATDYDDEGHLATMERAEEELDGLATTIANDLDLSMEKLGVGINLRTKINPQAHGYCYSFHSEVFQVSYP